MLGLQYVALGTRTDEVQQSEEGRIDPKQFRRPEIELALQGPRGQNCTVNLFSTLTGRVRRDFVLGYLRRMTPPERQLEKRASRSGQAVVAAQADDVGGCLESWMVSSGTLGT